MNGTWSFCECMLSGEDTRRWWGTLKILPAVIKFAGADPGFGQGGGPSFSGRKLPT